MSTTHKTRNEISSLNIFANDLICLWFNNLICNHLVCITVILNYITKLWHCQKFHLFYPIVTVSKTFWHTFLTPEIGNLNPDSVKKVHRLFTLCYGLFGLVVWLKLFSANRQTLRTFQKRTSLEYRIVEYLKDMGKAKSLPSLHTILTQLRATLRYAE